MSYRAKNSSDEWFNDRFTNKPFEEPAIETLAARIAYYNERCQVNLYTKKGGKWKPATDKDQAQFIKELDKQFFYHENKSQL